MTSPTPDLSKLRINRDAAPPALGRALHRNIGLGLAALALILGGVFAMRRGGAVPVQVLTATPITGSEGGAGEAGVASVTANGYVVARTRASVSAKLPGRIADLRVSQGSNLKQGQIIALLENADYQAQAAQAEAGLATARAELAEARAESEVLAREARRVAGIRAENAELVAEQELDNVEGRASQAAARVQAAAARLQAADAGRRYARANLENTVIRAPFSGTVLRKEAEVGEVVAPSVGGGLTRGAVVTMADLTTLEVEVDVNEAYISRIRKGAPAKITLGFHPRSVLASFLAESALIALVGGVIGMLLALPVNGMITSTTNWASFSEIAFTFRVTPGLLLAGLAFALVMGVVGGFFPARRAARQPVVQALR